MKRYILERIYHYSTYLRVGHGKNYMVNELKEERSNDY